MNQNTIITALAERIERLEAENKSLKMPPIEMALNTVFGINRESIVDFETKNVSPSNHYVILGIEFLNGIEQENERLKAENEILRITIDNKQKEYGTLNKNYNEEIQSLIAENKRLKAENGILIRFIDEKQSQHETVKKITDDDIQCLLAENANLKAENEKKEEVISEMRVQFDNFRKLLQSAPQWKNSAKDGLPNLDSDPVAIITICGGIIYMHHTMEDNDIDKLDNFDTEYYYFLVPRIGLDKIKKQ